MLARGVSSLVKCIGGTRYHVAPCTCVVAHTTPLRRQSIPSNCAFPRLGSLSTPKVLLCSDFSYRLHYDFRHLSAPKLKASLAALSDPTGGEVITVSVAKVEMANT